MQLAAVLAIDVPVFGPASEEAIEQEIGTTRVAACAVFTSAMRGCTEVDAAAARRASKLFAKLLTTSATAKQELQAVMEDVFQGAGKAGAASSSDSSLEAQRCALLLLLEHSITPGGMLRLVVKAAVAEHAARAGADFESILPQVLCSGVTSLPMLVETAKPLFKTYGSACCMTYGARALTVGRNALLTTCMPPSSQARTHAREFSRPSCAAPSAGLRRTAVGARGGSMARAAPVLPVHNQCDEACRRRDQHDRRNGAVPPRWLKPPL